MMYDPYIVHWGIKGQKWGVRRFQNEDGTLTSAGKQRYLGDRIKAFRSQRKLNKYDRIQNDSSYSKEKRAKAKAEGDRLRSDLKKEGFDVSSKDTKRMSAKTKRIIAGVTAGLAAAGAVAFLSGTPTGRRLVSAGKRKLFSTIERVRHLYSTDNQTLTRYNRTMAVTGRNSRGNTSIRNTRPIQGPTSGHPGTNYGFKGGNYNGMVSYPYDMEFGNIEVGRRKRGGIGR